MGTMNPCGTSDDSGGFLATLIRAEMSAMQILMWDDRRHPRLPRAVIQQGRCDAGHCGQFSISISNGERGMTVRFDSEDEFRSFIDRGAVEQPR
jgi:hypothetical protein